MKTTNAEVTELKKLLYMLFEHIGLGGFKLEAYEQNSFEGQTISVCLVRDFDIGIDAKGNKETWIRQIAEQVSSEVANSQAVKQAKKELKETIALLDDQLAKSQDTIKELEQYKTYYELEKQLRQAGK